MSFFQIIPIVVFVFLCVMVSYPIHSRMNSLLIGSLCASIIISLSFQAIGFFVTGYLDPFFLIASVVVLAASFTFSLAIGWLVKKEAKKRGKEKLK